LMAQLRSGAGPKEQQEFDLRVLLEQVVEDSQHREPTPELVVIDGDFTLNCDRDRLQTVFGHLIQNAQEATDKGGVITVRLLRERESAVVEVEDSGSGMDDEFVRNRLFRPFDSTKGLTGMGIGAFESRDFINNLGGRIQVRSILGRGSLFRVYIPCFSGANDEHQNTLHKGTVS